MNTEAPVPAPVPESPPPRARRRWLRWAWLLALPLAVVVLGVALIGAFLAALNSPDGTARLLSWLPRVQVTDPRGPLLGDFSARRISVDLSAPGHREDRVVIDDFTWQGFELARGQARGVWADWHLRLLRVARVEVHITPGEKSSAPPALPHSLRLPLRLRIDRLEVGEVSANALPHPVHGISARVDLGGTDGASHRIDELSLAWDPLRLQAHARIGADAPFPLDAGAELGRQVEAADEALPWQATLALSGPVARIEAKATLRAKDQSLDAEATLAPLASQPIDRLDAHFEGFDLAALAKAAPTTALTGKAIVSLDSAGRDAGLPLNIDLHATNAAADRWDLQHLPVRELHVQAVGNGRDLNAGVDLKAFDLSLGASKREAGRISGTGRWSPAQWQALLTLDKLEPAALDQRAPAMKLTGTVDLHGEPPPGGATTAAPSASTPQAAASTAEPPGETPPLSSWPVQVKTELTGSVQVGNAARDVSLSLDASLSPAHSVVRELVAASGSGRLQAQGEVRFGEGAQPATTIKLKAQVKAFEPALWWPGPVASAWRAQGHRLNGEADANLTLPARGPKEQLGPWIARITGQASARIAESTLAGLPLAASLELSSKAAGGGSLGTRGELHLAGNDLDWQGAIRPHARGADVVEPLRVRVHAPSLEQLKPLARWQNPAAELAGSLDASARLEGAWPRIALQGDFAANSLRWGGIRLESGQGNWQLGQSAQQPQLLNLQVRNLDAGGRRVSTAEVALQGTGLAHQLTLSAEALPPPPSQAASGPDAAVPAASARGSSAAAPAAPRAGASPTPAAVKSGAADGALADTASAAARKLHLALQVRGGVQVKDGDTPLSDLQGWKGMLESLELRTDKADPAPLLLTHNIEVQWQRERGTPATAPQSVSVGAGRAELNAGKNSAAVKWSRVFWQAAGPTEPAVLEAQAELEPLAIAPLLRDLQPNFRWDGDLRIAGRLSMRNAAGFVAEAEVARVGGDLEIREGGSVEKTELSDLRLTLDVRDGTWHFVPSMVGRRIGSIKGEFIARTDPRDLWPRPDASLSGNVLADFSDIGAWGAWIPAGWRVGGQLQVQAGLGGRMDAPEFTGAINGRKLSVRNSLQGVQVTDGEVRITLQGPTARIETFQARAGEGTARIEGGATFGEQPHAELKLVAERFAVLSRVDRRVVASGEARLLLEADNLKLDGGFTVDEGLIDISRSDAPALGGDVNVHRPEDEAAQEEAAAGRSAPRRHVALNLELDLGEKLRLRGYGLDTLLAGKLRLTTPGGTPTLVGDIETRKGTFAAYGQKLLIERGIIGFAGVIDNPRLDIEAIRPPDAFRDPLSQDVRVGVTITGTAQNPRIRLFSEPDMSDTEKLSWLMLGRGSSGGAEGALLQSALLALVSGSGEGSSPTEKLTGLVGLDELSVRKGDTDTKETIVSIGKQISQRWYVGYERSLNATAGSWQLVYKLAKSFTIRGQAGVDENAIDFIWTWRW